MRALIVDDEEPARAKVRRLLSAEPDIEIVGEAKTGREAVAAIRRSMPDIVFLDIQMPGLDGFGVLDAISRHEAPYVVFITADDQQAIRAFEVGAVDYLLKPFSPARFQQVLERARARLGNARLVAEASPDRESLERVLVIENGRAAFVPVDAIDRIEADRNYVTLFAGGARHRLRATLATIAGRLDRAKFIQVNRSTIVRLDAVRAIDEWSHGDYRVTMLDGTELTWSRRFRAVAERTFGVNG
ncbi:MAG TPA: LytTR family DNA-binding domain-containing protein [Gemmatimonadaceae bacterium]|nr:LytTR family DNA-binding domain-containing protein [Gemmatimonadaceae bacterium]